MVARTGDGGCHLPSDSAWQLLQLAVEKLWSAPGGPFVPRPCPAFRHFCYRRVGRAWYLCSHEHDVIGKWWKFAELTGCISRFAQLTTHSTLFIRCLFCAATIRGRKAHRYQRRLDKLNTSEMVTITRCCQWCAQLLSPAVNHGYDSYNTNTNSPSASMVTIVKKYSHTCVRATYTSHGYYSRAALTSFRAFDCVATIQGQWLFEDGIYLKKYVLALFSYSKMMLPE